MGRAVKVRVSKKKTLKTKFDLHILVINIKSNHPSWTAAKRRLAWWGESSVCQKGYFVCLCLSLPLFFSLCLCVFVRASSCAAFKNAKNENFDLWVTVAKPKYALLIYNALKSNTLSPHASEQCDAAMGGRGGESWVTTLSPCLAVFVSAYMYVCVCVWVWTWSGIGCCCCSLLGRCPGCRFGLSSWRCRVRVRVRVRIRQPPNVRKATRVRFMINMRYNTKYTINKQAGRGRAEAGGAEAGSVEEQAAPTDW